MVMNLAACNWQGDQPLNIFRLATGIATVAEIALALALLVGWQTRTAAFLSGSLLLLFGLAMAFSLGIKVPLDFSVFSAATGAFLLSGRDSYKLSLDDRKLEVSR
jgi:uncharacterized membrane protein YphA (DoxX/SURF4 family)